MPERNANVLGDYLKDGRVAAKDLTFATSLVSQVLAGRTLSQRQAYWVNKLCERYENPLPPAPKIDTNLTTVYEFIMRARQHLKYPKIVATNVYGELFRFYLSGERSKHPDTLNIVMPSTDTWFGRIFEDGTWHKPHTVTPEREAQIMELLTHLAEDPAGYAARHGKLTGNCCFCNRTLTDPRSTSAGFGPVCASRYGLTIQWQNAVKESGLDV